MTRISQTLARLLALALALLPATQAADFYAWAATPPGNLYAYGMTTPATGPQVRITSLGTTANTLGKPVKSVTLLGYNGKLTWKQEANALVVTLPDTSAFKTALGFKIETN